MAIPLCATLTMPGGALLDVQLELGTSPLLGCHSLCVYTSPRFTYQLRNPSEIAKPRWQDESITLRRWIHAPEQRKTLVAGLISSFLERTRYYTHIIMSGPINIGTPSRDDGSHANDQVTMAELVAALIESGEGVVVATPISKNRVHGDRQISLVQTWVFIPNESAACSIPGSAAIYGLDNVATRAKHWAKSFCLTSVRQAHEHCLSTHLRASEAFKNCFNFFLQNKDLHKER